MSQQVIAAGIDLGGTKAEVQLFDDAWAPIARHREDTPEQYDALLEMLVDQVRWIHRQVGSDIPVGLGTSGIVQPDGRLLAANLAASGQRLQDDLERATGQPITLINDARAFALSEAVFGAGKDHHNVLAIILGTGVGGGLIEDKRLRMDRSGSAGEFGHTAAPAAVIVRHGLPIHSCGCGRVGCVETYLSGPGLSRLAETLTGRLRTPRDISDQKTSDPDAQRVWRVWCDIAAELMLGLVMSTDPDVIVLGGGLSRIPGVADDLGAALSTAQILGFGTPPIVLAAGGPESGARGAAYAAHGDANA